MRYNEILTKEFWIVMEDFSWKKNRKNVHPFRRLVFKVYEFHDFIKVLD